MEEAVEELINYIMSIQDEGPYLLGDHCNGGYVAYEIERRLASRGHRVDLLALVESPGVGQSDRLFRLRRRLLFSVTRPMELLSYLTGKLGKVACRYVHNNMSIDNVDLHREFDRVFGDYCWVRLRSGLPTYRAASHSSTATGPSGGDSRHAAGRNWSRAESRCTWRRANILWDCLEIQKVLIN
jgi:hypothetical protein